MKRKVNFSQERQHLRRSLSGCGGFGAMSMAAAASTLGVSIGQLRARIRSGLLLSIRVRGERMIPRSELRRELQRTGRAVTRP